MLGVNEDVVGPTVEKEVMLGVNEDVVGPTVEKEVLLGVNEDVVGPTVEKVVMLGVIEDVGRRLKVAAREPSVEKVVVSVMSVVIEDVDRRLKVMGEIQEDVDDTSGVPSCVEVSKSCVEVSKSGVIQEDVDDTLWSCWASGRGRGRRGGQAALQVGHYAARI